MASVCSPRASCADRRRKSCPPRADDSNVSGGDPVRSELRATTRRARGKRPRGAGLLRRNGNSTTAPGEARPPRTLPNRRASRRRRAMPQTSPSPLGVLGRSYTTGLRGRAATGWGGLGNASTGSPLADPLPPGFAFGSATVPRRGTDSALFPHERCYPERSIP